MAEDDTLKGSLVDQLTLLNENLKEDLADSRKEKKKKSKLAKAITNLAVPMSALGLSMSNFVRDVGSAMVTAAEAGRATNKMQVSLFSTLKGASLSLESHTKAVQVSFGQGLRQNEQAVLKFVMQSKLLGKDINGLVESIMTQTDQFGFSSDSSLKFTQGIIDSAMKNKISSDALIKALSGLKDSILSGAAVFGPGLARIIPKALEKLTARYGQGATAAIQETLKVVFSDTGWQNMVRAGITMPAELSADAVVSVFEQFKSVAEGMGNLNRETAAAQRDVMGFASPLMFSIRDLKRQTPAMGSGFQEGYNVARSAPMAVLNRMLNELKAIAVPELIRVFEAISRHSDEIVTGIRDFSSILWKLVSETLPKFKDAVVGIANWADDRFGNWGEKTTTEKIKTGAEVGGLALLIATITAFFIGQWRRLKSFFAGTGWRAGGVPRGGSGGRTPPIRTPKPPTPRPIPGMPAGLDVPNLNSNWWSKFTRVLSPLKKVIPFATKLSGWLLVAEVLTHAVKDFAQDRDPLKVSHEEAQARLSKAKTELSLTSFLSKNDGVVTEIERRKLANLETMVMQGEAAAELAAEAFSRTEYIDRHIGSTGLNNSLYNPNTEMMESIPPGQTRESMMKSRGNWERYGRR